MNANRYDNLNNGKRVPHCVAHHNGKKSFLQKCLTTIIDYFFAFVDFLKHVFSHVNLSFILQLIMDQISPTFGTNDTLFEADDVDDFFGEKRGGEKFIDKYTESEVTSIIRNSSLGTKISYFIPDWYVEFDLSDCFSHYGYIRSYSQKDKEKYYGFIIVQVGPFSLENPEATGNGAKYLKNNIPSNPNLLNIRWFSLQNPAKEFSPEKPRLPGQRYPGTGLGRDALQLLVRLAKKAGRDGIVNNPEHFHNAFMYENFLFLNPTHQGRFLKIKSDLSEDLKKKGLSAVSWAIYLGFLRENGEKIHWDLKEQVLPLSIRMSLYFHMPKYNSLMKKAFKSAGPFTIDWEGAEKTSLLAIIKYSPDEARPTSHF